MRAKFKNFLSQRNIAVEKEEDNGIIVFSYDGLYYFFVSDNVDPHYFRLILPGIINTASHTEEYLKFANEVTQQFKVIKTYIQSDNYLALAAEQFIYSDENIDKLFSQCLSSLQIVSNYIKLSNPIKDDKES